MNGLKIIKLFVFVLTAIIFFGLILCAKIIYNNTHRSHHENISLQQPYGTKIKNILALEKDLYIMVKGGGINDRILVYSPEEHKVLYIINVD